MSETEFLIGLDFLGAGNLGDDLMVSGFLEGIRQLGLTEKMRRLRALCSYNRASQRHRFPQIDWLDGRSAKVRKAALKKAGVHLGVGGTPFQMTVGDWLLKNLEEVVSTKQPQAPLLLVNVGGESEAARAIDRFQSVMKETAAISTRDSSTLELLTKWRNGQPTPKLVAGADLANITLPNLCKDHPPLDQRPHELAIILGADTLAKSDIRVVIDWMTSSTKPVAWITCEVRNIHGGEYRLYLRYRYRFAWFLNKRSPQVELLRPDYKRCSTTELVAPFARCKTVLSSRYHGILSAAWSGCKVGGIARSSKVKWLCAQLGLPTISPPFTPEALEQLRADAHVVDPSILEQLRAMSLGSLDALGLGSY